jgi:hypothetical protein
MLLATPLMMLVGCGGGSESKPDAPPVGGAGGSRLDGAPGTGGAALDAGGRLDVPPAPGDTPPPVDTTAATDVVLPVDVTVVPDIPIVPDVAQVLDVNSVDAPIADTKPPAVEVPPVDTATEAGPVATCTETAATKFKGGTVNADRTLTAACSPYTITSDIDVGGNATLTIEPGVTVRFGPDMNLSIGYNAAAKLVAVGTAAAPIVFTSSNATPGAGDWAGVQLWSNTMNGTALGYLTMDYCGSNGDACLLGTGAKPNRVTVDHVTFAHVGAGSDAIWEKDKDSNFVISNCTFNDIPTTPTQQYAISVYAPSFVGIDSTNVFAGGAMVALMGDTVSTTTTWKNIGTAVAVTAELSIGGTTSPTLTIAAGSTFKFANGVPVSVGYNDPGKLVVAGTATSRVTLTSLAATPGPGDWDGIVVWSASSATLSYTTVSYAGSDGSSGKGAVSVISDNDTLSISNSTISNSGTYGIGVPCGSTATITNTGNTFTANASGDVGPGPSDTAPACQ